MQISVFYLLIIAFLGWWGFTNSMKIASVVGMPVGEAMGAALGAVVGIFISYQMYEYAKRKGMVAY